MKTRILQIVITTKALFIIMMLISCNTNSNSKTKKTSTQKSQETVATTHTDYLSVGNTIQFNQEDFYLQWSSHPTNEYYKQEYLRKEDKLPNYEKMIIIEAVKGNISVNQAVKSKMNELENWKKQNPIVNYQKVENKKKNEVILDFLVSDGKSIYEWNVYRYQKQKNKNKEYLVLYAYSYRNYVSNKDELLKFLADVKHIRVNLVNKISKITLPKVNPK